MNNSAINNQQLTSDYRYPGSRPFQDTDLDRRLFFGRKHEQQSLLHKVLAERLVILFAKSGIGKTSLLNAGLLQTLRKRELFPLTIRFNESKIDPLQAVYRGIKDTIGKYKIDYIAGEKNTLWEYFKTVGFWSSENILLTPVLILDQFEEFFTVHSSESRRSFITQLSDLVKGRAPKDLQESFASEEEFLYDEISPNVRIIISIREDFLGQLEEMAHEIPGILQDRFRISALTREQARQAIVEPAKLQDEQITAKSFSYKENAVEAMLDFLCKRKEGDEIILTDEVEPFQLQLLCQHIENTVRKKLEKENTTDIDVKKDDLGGEIGMQRVLQDFYDNQINRLGSIWKKRRVRKLCQKGLISASNRRLSLEEEEIERQFKVPKSLLAEFVNSRLLRAEPRVGSIYYELSHDTLVEPIRRSQSSLRPLNIVSGISLSAIIIIIVIFLIKFIFQSYILPERINRANKYFNQGVELYRQDKYDEAIMNYRKALELDQKYTSAYYKLGVVLREQGQYNEVIANYNKVIEFDPKNSYAYYDLGEAFRLSGKFKEAIANYEKAIENDSNNSYAYSGLGDALRLQGKFKEAIANYEKAIELNPNNSYTYYGLGEAFRSQGKFEEAIINYQTAIKLDSNNSYAYSGLGDVLRLQGKYEEAIANYEEAIKLNSNNTYT